MRTSGCHEFPPRPWLRPREARRGELRELGLCEGCWLSSGGTGRHTLARPHMGALLSSLSPAGPQLLLSVFQVPKGWGRYQGGGWSQAEVAQGRGSPLPCCRKQLSSLCTCGKPSGCQKPKPS